MGTIILWASIASVILWIIIGAAKESGNIATTGFVVFLIVLGLFGQLYTAIEWISSHWIEAICLTFAYFLIGLAWSMVKWYLTILRLREIFEGKKDIFKCHIDHNETASERRNRFVGYINSNHISANGIEAGYFNGTSESLVPNITNCTPKLIFWMSYWPFSMLWSISHNLVQSIATQLVQQYRKAYEKIALYVWSKIEVNLTEENKGC